VFIWGGIAFAAVKFLMTASRGEVLGWATFLGIVFALAFLAIRFEIVGRLINKFVAGYFLFFGWVFVVLGPLVLFNWLSQSIRSLSVRYQMIVFGAWGLLLSWAVLLIATERKRERFFNRFQRIGALAPVAYSLNLLFIAAMFFSSVTFVLSERGALRLSRPSEATISPDTVLLFYIWHFLDALPLLNVNETMHWSEPLSYESAWVGLMLLLFKLAVIVPVIGAFAWYWKQVGAQKPGAAQGLSKAIGAARFMKVVIAGGTGQVGTILAREFHRRGDEVVILSRTPRAAPWRIARWDAETLGDWAAELEGADVVINLAGRSVNCRYNAKNRKLITESRVKSTQVVGEAIARASNPPRVWLQASTATIYAHTYDNDNDEISGAVGCAADAPDAWRFSNEVVTSWEQAANEANTPKTRKVLLRSAIVMSPDRGGAFDILLRLVRFGLGGRAGDGRQYVSWIHDRDFIRCVFWLIEHEELDGPVNLTSPNPLSNAEFMEGLRQAWGSRFGLPATKWMLEIGAFLLRTETELILKSRRVVPGRLLESGFVFQFPAWTEAARDLCQRRRQPT